MLLDTGTYARLHGNFVISHVKLQISIGNSMICSDVIGINTTSDISKLFHVISRAVRRVKFETILKYQEWYLCQISRPKRGQIKGVALYLFDYL